MKPKLPGFSQTTRLIELYRKIGLSDKEISARLITDEELILTQIISEIEGRMNEEEKKQFDQFIITHKPTPKMIASYLNLDQEKLSRKIEEKIQKLIDQLSREPSVFKNRS